MGGRLGLNRSVLLLIFGGGTGVPGEGISGFEPFSS